MTETREAAADVARVADGRILRDLILGEFAPEVSPTLIEFAELIAAIDADFVIFMARKALRLYDLLVLAGCATNERVMLSSHVLEQDLEKFRGKRVALVDDTLILGTTLGAATRRLRAVGAEVSSYVFAVDKENWQSDLASPDKYMMALEHDALLTLCVNEVEALAVAGIPYLADFPVTRSVRFSKRRLDLFHALQNWTPYPLTSERQREFGTLVFSMLPTAETRERLQDVLGPFGPLTDIAKVRAFGQTRDGELWFRFVPVLTLKPIPVGNLPRLWAAVLARGDFDDSQRTLLESHLIAPKAKLRFLQYCASVRLGRAFCRDLESGVGIPRSPQFDEAEGVRLFGPWLRPILTHLHRHDQVAVSISELQAADVPPEVATVSRKELLAVVRHEPENSPDTRARNIFTDLTRAFSQLYRDHELPAREEARRLGPAIFDANATNAPHRDRLEYGFAWDTLVDCMLGNEGVRNTPGRSIRLSLLLDVLIDIGIAVPILCERNGVLFRAYRHGEDVSFADQEAALAHDILSGYCEASGRATVPRLVCEKLLVSLFRVGVAKGFLRIVHGIGGGERVARIGFHLHGALPFVPMDDTIFAEDHDSWLSTYLADIGVIAHSPGGGYVVGARPEAAVPKATAAAEARQLGWLIGRLMHDKDSDGAPVLDSDGLVLLTTCPQPKDAASAVIAELRIFLRWFSTYQRTLEPPPITIRQIRGREHIDWTSLDSIQTAHKRFVGGQGYLALHSGRLKISGYSRAAARTAFDRCADYLGTLEGGAFFEAHWRGDWSSIVELSNLDQSDRFSALLQEMDLELFYLAIGAFSIELGLLSAEAALAPSAEMASRYSIACTKALSYITDLHARVSPNPAGQDLYERLCHVAGTVTYMPTPAQACVFGAGFIERRRHMVATLIRRSKDAIASYGTKEPRTSYKLSLWYDIIDSTGQKSGLTGDSLRAYRERVRVFKRAAGDNLGALIRAAAQQNGNVYCWNAPLESPDDEKNVFFSGRNALNWMRDASELLLRTARDCGIRLRMLMINGDFAGDAPHKTLSLPQVDGEGYWENVSRVKERVKLLEKALTSGHGGSIVWAAQDVIPDVIDTFPHLVWRGQTHREAFTVEIENYPLEVQVCGGPINL